MPQHSPIFTKTYDLLRWLLPTTQRFPKSQRFVLAQQLQRTAFALQEALTFASKNIATRDSLQKADAHLAQLRIYWRLAKDLELISLGQYEHGARLMDEIGRLLGGWQKSLK